MSVKLYFLPRRSRRDGHLVSCRAEHTRINAAALVLLGPGASDVLRGVGGICEAGMSMGMVGADITDVSSPSSSSEEDRVHRIGVLLELGIAEDIAERAVADPSDLDAAAASALESVASMQRVVSATSAAALRHDDCVVGLVPPFDRKAGRALVHQETPPDALWASEGHRCVITG